MFPFTERISRQFATADSTENTEMYKADSIIFPISTVATALKAMC
jgi:hypothetical protein